MYAGLIYGGDPAKLSPTISDVHTDPNAGKVLEEGVGDATFLVVAVDNKADRALYMAKAQGRNRVESADPSGHGAR